MANVAVRVRSTFMRVRERVCVTRRLIRGAFVATNGFPIGWQPVAGSYPTEHRSQLAPANPVLQAHTHRRDVVFTDATPFPEQS